MMKKRLRKDLAITQEKWGRDSKNNRLSNREDNVADVCFYDRNSKWPIAQTK
jgi:hypothetical protein